MNTFPEKNGASNEMTSAEVLLHDFMVANLERDPDWFHEPEDTAEYGPPGMPTPFVPLDPRIAPRQRGISKDLRRLISKERLPAFLNSHLINMLEVNFDSFNTILGESNNDSYTRWKTQSDSDALSPELKHIEELGVLGLASQKEISRLLRETDGFQSAEFSRLFHPLKYRMRHLPHLREVTNEMIVDAGGTLVDNSDGSAYYGLKLFPYVVESYVALSAYQQREIDLLNSSIFKKWEALHEGLNQAPNGSIDDEMYNAVSDAIDVEEARILAIKESTQRHTIEGLMASVKRCVGSIPKNSEKDIKVAERQVFAVDLASYYKQLTPSQVTDFDAAMHDARLAKSEQPASVLKIKQDVANLFITDSQLIIPVSTTTYGFEASTRPVVYSSISPALAQLAMRRTNRLRN
jgi:hypothetical protein